MVSHQGLDVTPEAPTTEQQVGKALSRKEEGR